jgi:glucokinase
MTTRRRFHTSATAPPKRTVLACDAGGTVIKLGLVREGRLLARGEIPSQAEHGLAAAPHRMAKEARRLCRECGLRLRDLSGLGLAFPGIIEPQSPGTQGT